MKNRGFTLIEILGVLIILGIITAITLPVAKKYISSSKQKLYDEQINGIKGSLKDWAHENIFLLPESTETITLSLGQLKQSGHTTRVIKNPKNNKCFSNESLLTISKKNNNYIYDVKEIIEVNCDLLENAPTIKINGDEVKYLNIGDSYKEEGASSKSSNGSDISSNITSTIIGDSNTVDTSKKGIYNVIYSINDSGKIMTAIRTIIVRQSILTSNNSCINNTNKCENGTLVNVKVNDKENYDFYVIKDDGNELTLIMNKNLGSRVFWITKEDYLESGGTAWNELVGTNSKGPLTVLKALEIRTQNWTNIKSYDYTLIDDKPIPEKYGSKVAYEPIKRTNVRARLLTFTEALTLGCEYKEKNTCPKYLYENLGLANTDEEAVAYWLSTSDSNYITCATNITFEGDINSDDTTYSRPYGVRPVIKVSKTI